jgi:hypothetical protein
MTRSSEEKPSGRRAAFIVGLSIQILENAEGSILISGNPIAAILMSEPCRR